MTKSGDKRRAPAALRLDDPNVAIPQAVPQAEGGALSPEPGEPAAVVPSEGAIRRGIKWGGLLFSALGGLIALATGLWLTDFVTSLLQRNDWLGWLTLGLLSLAVFAAFMIALTEIWALMRLGRLGRLRKSAQSAIKHDDRQEAEQAAKGVRRLYASRADLAWGRARLAEHDHDIMDARERLVLTERELMTPLDAQAKSIIAATARRVSVLTAVSPSTITDMIAVAILNLRMLRRIAATYGARPGTFGLFRLARMVLTHIVLTGGIAIGDDLIQQLVGQRLTAKLSARLGEGVFNGALTARIGLAALDVCRPLPCIEARRPRLRDLVSLAIK
jgi:putative membrane protein